MEENKKYFEKEATTNYLYLKEKAEKVIAQVLQFNDIIESENPL